MSHAELFMLAVFVFGLLEVIVGLISSKEDFKINGHFFTRKSKCK